MIKNNICNSLACTSIVVMGIAFIACNENGMQPNQADGLKGRWTQQLEKYIVYYDIHRWQLDFGDSTFVLKIDSGTDNVTCLDYDGETKCELSNWTIAYKGTFEKDSVLILNGKLELPIPSEIPNRMYPDSSITETFEFKEYNTVLELIPRNSSNIGFPKNTGNLMFVRS